MQNKKLAVFFYGLMSLSPLSLAYGQQANRGEQSNKYSPKCGYIAPNAIHKSCLALNSSLTYDWYIYSISPSSSLCVFSPQLGNITVDQQYSIFLVDGRREFMAGKVQEGGAYLQAHLWDNEMKWNNGGSEMRGYSFNDFDLITPSQTIRLMCREEIKMSEKIRN